MTMTGTIKGREIQAGDGITFVPGGKPIRFVRIDAEQHTHAGVGMTYRLGYDYGGVGYALFDEATCWRTESVASALPVSAATA